MKICGITRPGDADAAIDAGADAIGLVFFPPSGRHLEFDVARALAERAAAFVTVVAVVVDPPPQWLRRMLAEVPVDLVQFHGREDPAQCMACGRPYLKALRMRNDVDPAAAARRFAGARALLCDTYVAEQVGGTGQSFAWQRLADFTAKPLVLAGGIGVDNAAAAIRAVRPYGLDVSSGVEQAPGIKDPARIRRLLRAVRRADAELYDAGLYHDTDEA